MLGYVIACTLECFGVGFGCALDTRFMMMLVSHTIESSIRNNCALSERKATTASQISSRQCQSVNFNCDYASILKSLNANKHASSVRDKSSNMLVACRKLSGADKCVPAI
jgi:hypothetical protein